MFICKSERHEIDSARPFPDSHEYTSALIRSISYKVINFLVMNNVMCLYDPCSKIVLQNENFLNYVIIFNLLLHQVLIFKLFAKLYISMTHGERHTKKRKEKS